jgi:hypothetical protein
MDEVDLDKRVVICDFKKPQTISRVLQPPKSKIILVPEM